MTKRENESERERKVSVKKSVSVRVKVSAWKTKMCENEKMTVRLRCANRRSISFGQPRGGVRAKGIGGINGNKKDEAQNVSMIATEKSEK